MPDWNTMESAPRDGTWILGLASKDSSPYRVSWGRNHNDKLAWCTSCFSFVDGYITHWMPWPSRAAAVHYICARKSRKAADEYFGKIASGIGFGSRRDPAYKVRDYLTRSDESRLTRRDVAVALIQGWNALRTNKPLGAIKSGDKIARVV